MPFPAANSPGLSRSYALPRVALLQLARDHLPFILAALDRLRDNPDTTATALDGPIAQLVKEKGGLFDDVVAVGLSLPVSQVASMGPVSRELFFTCIRVGAALVPLNWRLAPSGAERNSSAFPVVAGCRRGAIP